MSSRSFVDEEADKDHVWVEGSGDQGPTLTIFRKRYSYRPEEILANRYMQMWLTAIADHLDAVDAS